MKYLIIKCEELDDQYECDADRIPVCMTDDYTEYDKYGYEIYETDEKGNLQKIREYTEGNEKCIAYREYENGNEIRAILLKYGSRYVVTKQDIRKWKKRFKIGECTNNILMQLFNNGIYKWDNDNDSNYHEFTITEERCENRE